MKVSKLIGAKIPKMVAQRLKDVSQNYLVAQFYNSYGDIVIFAGLEFRAASLSSTLSILSLLAAIFCTILGVVMLYAHVKVLKRYQELKREGEMNDKKSYQKLEQFKAAPSRYLRLSFQTLRTNPLRTKHFCCSSSFAPWPLASR